MTARTLIVPTHPGVQYHFCRVGLPTYFLGHWDQFQYWRPQPANVHNLLPAFEDAHLDYGPTDYARLLDRGVPFEGGLHYPEDFDVAWLMFTEQFHLFRERRSIPKVYHVAKIEELSPEEWAELLSRDDFRVAVYYPNTAAWVKERFGVDVPYIPIGLDPDTYGPYTGEDVTALSVIHSWKDRGWNHASWAEATRDLPTTHVDHLDPSKPVYRYEDLLRAMRRSRLFVHDGEQEYTVTLIEAMMTGMPIVSFRLPGIERYVEHGKNGLLVDVGDPDALREACRLLLDDADLAMKMGAHSRAIALRDYSEEKWRNDWLALIGGFVGPGRG